MNACWVILGAGGHGAVIADTLELRRQHIVGFLDDIVGQTEEGWPVLGPTAALSDTIALNGIDAVALGIGDNRSRRRLGRRAMQLAACPPIVHPTATVSVRAQIADGAFIGPHAVVNTRAVIGTGAIVNTGATVDHHCSVDAWAHVAPGAHLAGRVHIGEGVLFGVGACAKPGVTIGGWSIIGAGAVVVADIPAGVIAVGCPARPRPAVSEGGPETA